METLILLGAKAAVAATLLIAGGAKLADISGFAATTRLFMPWRLPRLLTRCFAVGAAVTELMLGALSLSSPSVRWLNLVIFAVTLLFLAIASLGYALHRGRSCRCFGALSQRRFDARGIARSAAIAAIAAVAIPGAPTAAIRIDAPERTALAIGAIMLSLAAFTAASSIGTTRATESRLTAR